MLMNKITDDHPFLVTITITLTHGTFAQTIRGIITCIKVLVKRQCKYVIAI